MSMPILILFISLTLSFLPLSFSTPYIHSLNKGSSLSVEKPDQVLISPNGVFSAGFHSVGDNAYCFAIWFSEPLYDESHTIVWMANRDQPINGRLSKLSLLQNGNLILTDAANSTFGPPALSQSLQFDSLLVSSRSQTNYSSGFYNLFFDNDNVLRFLFAGPETSRVCIYWPDPWLNNWETLRSSYNDDRTAVLNSSGHFKSTDNFEFTAVDSGIGTQKRLTMDYDGNIRLYSLDKIGKIWSVSWQAIQKPCNIHGICGPNSLCTYVPLRNLEGDVIVYQGTRLKVIQTNLLDVNQNLVSLAAMVRLVSLNFLMLNFMAMILLSIVIIPSRCVRRNACSVVTVVGFNTDFTGAMVFTNYNCYTKSLLLNGYRSTGFPDPMYIKLPKVTLKSYTNHVQGFSSDCPRPVSLQLNRIYKKPQENETLQFLVWFASAIGGVEIICVCLVFCFLYRTRPDSVATTQSYLQIATGFRKFTYSELKQATHNFGEEIGRGGGGIVYKGVLSDHRVAAIKQLNDANQGEAEFLAEASTIGRVNHMNLIEVWGYCAEGKHRLLVYEYMEHGSLAENHATNTLDWVKRFDIAVGSAKGLSYLHEECLEWVLHCDVKPQNILLDSNYHPKVADFGLSKLLNRGGGHNSSFSKVRGTRGYMAPEWIFNHRITSKVDVYSYGVVVLEMVTGKSPLTNSPSSGNSGEMEQRHLVKWVREKMNETVAKESWLEEIIDPVMKGRYDASKMEILVGVALQCVEENKDARRTMSQVIERLVHHEPSDY
ncbi:unnamed protein product [Camellia sinensis]